MSPLGGGGDRSWLATQKPDGCNQLENTTTGASIQGSHKGFYTGLNASNPRPGFRYLWERNTPQSVFLARQRGWEVVSMEDSDAPAFAQGLYDDNDSDRPTPLDTSGVFQDVVYMRTPIERYRRMREETANEARRIMEGSTQDFLDGASSAEMATGQTKRGYLPTRIARNDHSAVMESGDGNVRGQVPMRGIVKE